MALASDLMGLGMPSHLARRLGGGEGAASSLLVASAGTTAATATALGPCQFLVSVNVTSTAGTGGLILPAVGGTGCLLGDDFVINNATGQNVNLYAQTGSSMSFNGSNISGSVGVTIATHKSIACFPVSATQWVGILGA